MAFEDILGYAALAGVVLVVIGTILLALFPRWGGFRVQRADEAPRARWRRSSRRSWPPSPAS